MLFCIKFPLDSIAWVLRGIEAKQLQYANFARLKTWQQLMSLNEWSNHGCILSLLSPQEHAFENSQKYKEGKFIIEMAHMIKDNGWE